MGRHALPEPAEPAHAGRCLLGPRDVRDAGVTEPGQVADGHPGALLVVDRDRGKAVVLREPVHQHHRQVGRRRLGEQAIVQGGGGEHETVDVTGPHLLEDQALPAGVGVGVADQGHVARRGELVFQAADDRREERVVQVRNQHPDRVRAAGPQAARNRIGPVAELGGGGRHPASGVLADQDAGFRIERAGRGGRMDTGRSSHISQGGRPLRHDSSRSPTTWRGHFAARRRTSDALTLSPEAAGEHYPNRLFAVVNIEDGSIRARMPRWVGTASVWRRSPASVSTT